MVCGQLSYGNSSLLAFNNATSRNPRSRCRCVRPEAVASSDVRTDDTAEARRRLARQFRRHKLEPQPAVPAAANLNIQGLRPRPQQHQPLIDPQWQQPAQPQGEPLTTGQSILFDPDMDWSADAAADAASAAPTAAAAARQLLERQFMLGSNPNPGLFEPSNRGSSSSGFGYAAQLPASLLLDTISSTAGAAITKAIKRAGHWRQVQSLIQEHAPDLSAIHLCASLTRLVQLQDSFASSGPAAVSQRQQQQGAAGLVDHQVAVFMQQLMASISAKQQYLEYRQACNVLWAVSKLHAVAAPSQEWLCGMYQHAMSSSSSKAHEPQQEQEQKQQASREYEMMHAAQLAYSLVELQQLLPQQQVHGIAAWLQDTTQGLLQELLHIQQTEQKQRQSSSQQKQQQLAELDAHHQQHQGPGQQQQPEQQQAAVHVGARDLATLAWSLATLGLQPSTAWLSAFASAVGSKGVLAAGNHQDLSMLLWATATFSKSVPEGSAAANSLHAAAGALLAACQELSLRGSSAQCVSNTLWALATLGQRPSVVWLNKLLQHLEGSAVKTMNPQGVSVTLWALAALGVVPRHSCMSALLSAAGHQLQHITPQGAANTIWALAILEHVPSKPWLAGFWPESRALLADMTSQGLVNCLWAVARLGVQPPQEWVVDAAQLLLDQGVQNLSSQGLSNVLWAMARITNRGRQGQELLDLGLQQTVLLLEQQQQQQQQVEVQREAAAAVFNIYELSGLMHTVSVLAARESSLLQQQQQQALQQQGLLAAAGGVVGGSSRSRSPSPTRPVRLQRFAAPAGAGSSSSSCCSSATSSIDASDVEDAAQPDLLPQLAGLLQSASLPLLAAAGPSELSILLWSQVSMSAGPLFGQTGQTPGQNLSQTFGQALLVIPRPWMDGWLDASQGCFGSASSRDLAQWVWCLAKRGVRPSGQWLASFQVASFRQMGKANSQDLSNMLWALACLGTPPEPAWLQQHLREVSRRQAHKQLLPQHLSNLGWALARLGHRPDRDWLARYQEDVYEALPGFKPQEMTNVLWALAVLNCKAERALIDECLSVMASQLPSFKANEVAVALWAVARLRGQPDMRLMAAALQHCFSQARQLSPKGLSMLMWSVGNMATPPPKAWVVKLLVATQVRMSGFSAQELSMLAVSLARLEYRPPDAWLDCFAAAAAAQMNSFGAQALANTLWALATLHYTPAEAWMTAFDEQLQQHLPSFTPAHIAMTMWAMSSLQWLPAQPLWQQLQERAELHSASFCLRSRRMLSRAVRVLEKIEAEDEEQ